MKQINQSNLFSWTLLLSLAIIWGVNFLFIKIAVLEVGPITNVFLRLIIAAAILYFFMILTGNKLILKTNGIINLKTDSLFLHGYTLGLLENGPYKIIQTMHDLYNTYYTDNRLNIKTYYENQFLNKNQIITYIAFSFLD